MEKKMSGLNIKGLTLEFEVIVAGDYRRRGDLGQGE